MKRKFFIMIAVLLSVLCSCHSNPGAADSYNSKNSLNWPGVYSCTFQTTDGIDLLLRLKLNRDQSYELTDIYPNRTYPPFTWTGSFSWDDTGNIITFIIADAPSHYRVTKNKLVMLDNEKNEINDKLSHNYDFIKVR